MDGDLYRAEWNTRAGTQNQRHVFVYSDGEVMQPGQWYHVAALFDAARMRLFVSNGNGPGRQPFELPETQGGFLSGVDPQLLPADQSDRFHGLIDSVQVSGARLHNSFERYHH
ncbi:MAG: LamG-like jellyroll fold domain-containing protein [Planctomycetaceae bacterium]